MLRRAAAPKPDQVNRHGNADQRQERAHEHTLLAERAICEVVPVHFASQAHRTLHGNQIHERADRD
jgi:hypothetical protein